MVFNLSEHNNIGQRFIGELRDIHIQKDRMRFRRNMERLGEILAYEISKTLKYHTIKVETPLGVTNVHVPLQQVVLGTILRAGLPLHQGMLNYFDDAGNAFVSAYRKHHKDGTFEIESGYVSCPKLDGSVLLLSDPMLATGASISLAAEELMKHGEPAALHFVTAIASSAGLEHVQRIFPKASVWMGALDDELTAKSFIVPGLGDAGDLSFGEKVQD